MKAFKSTAQYTAYVPMTVTKAADTLAAICNREDTIPRVGAAVTRDKYSHGWHIVIDFNTMGFIIGRELAESFQATIAKPAYAEYFGKIQARLNEVGIAIAPCPKYWFLHKLPRFNPEDEQLYVYTYEALVNQAPAGFTANY